MMTGFEIDFEPIGIRVPCTEGTFISDAAREAGVPILTAEVLRRGWVRHEWRITGRVESDPRLDEAEDRRRIMQAVMDRLGESVRAHPENYFWFNKRWVLGGEPRP